MIPECQCARAGHCKLFNRPMHPEAFRQCQTNEEFRSVWYRQFVTKEIHDYTKGIPDRAPQRQNEGICIHRGEQIDTVICQFCGSDKGKEFPVYSCPIHERCTDNLREKGLHFCAACEEFQE